MTRSAKTMLSELISGQEITNADHVSLKAALKPIFFRKNGFMDWAKAKRNDKIKESIIEEGNRMIDSSSSDSDELIDKFSSAASELNQGGQLNLYYDLLAMFQNFEGEKLSERDKELLQIIQAALESGSEDSKNRAIMLVSMFAESSNAQSRKSTAGIAGELAIELLMRNIGLVKGETYGTQFVHMGSNTDFVVPFANSGEVHKVKAYIAVQVSTNDRARLSGSELHRGAKRYLCSLNGCSASTKDTTDIGDDLAAGYLESETHYVVIESERLRAIEDAERRVKKNEETDKVVSDNLCITLSHVYDVETLVTKIKDLLAGDATVIDLSLEEDFIQELKFSECLSQQQIDKEISARYTLDRDFARFSKKSFSVLHLAESY